MRKFQFGLHPSWVIVLAGVCAALHIGKLSPALPVLQAALDISLVQAGFLLSVVQVGSMTLGLAVGLSVDSLGLRRSMVTGLLLLSSASWAGGFATDAVTLLLLRACEGLGFLLTVMPAPALIRRTVEADQLNGRMGWWGTFMPLGNALALLVGPVVMAVMSWSVWWWGLSWVSLLACFAVWRYVPNVKPPIQTPQQADSADNVWPQRLALTMRSAGPWWVSLSFAVYASQWIAVIGFLPTVYAEMGLTARLTGVLTACVAVANVSGNVMAGRLLQRGWRAQRLLQIGFGCMALGAVGAFAQWHGQSLPLAGRFLSVVMFSAVGGLIPGTLFSMAVRLAPSEGTVSTTVGYMQQWSALGQFAGPPVVAWVAASVGGWQWTWVVTVSLCAAGVVLSLCIERALAKLPHPSF